MWGQFCTLTHLPLSLSYSFTHFIFVLGLITLLQFDNKDTSTSFIFLALVMETNVLGTAA
jgi:hypothetical protein